MDNREQDNPNEISLNRDSQINLVINQPDDGDDEIDLGRVFGRMKRTRRVYAWLLLLCMLVGICAPVAMYEVTRAPLTVSSVVELNYQVPMLDKDGNPVLENDIPQMEAVSDLTAPDGTELDLDQVTSAYVLGSAMDGLKLSKPITISVLQGNLKVTRVLSEESSRNRELIADMRENKNSDTYNQLINAKTTYAPRFIVSLTNGFGEEDSRVKTYLKDDELTLVLNRVLEAYNDYLVQTYQTVDKPDDRISALDTAGLDPTESLEEVNKTVAALLDWGKELPENIRKYRSWQTGQNMEDLLSQLKMIQNTEVDSLRANLFEKNVVRDKDALLATYQYQLVEAQENLKKLNEKIADTTAQMTAYRTDNITVLMQMADSTHSSQAVSDYYNDLVSDQMDQYSQVTELETQIADLQDRMTRVQENETVRMDTDMEEQLDQVIRSCREIYDRIVNQVEEIQEGAVSTQPTLYSAPMGKRPGFLSANMKRIAIGLILGLLVGFAVWFFSALAPEFHRDEKTGGKEAA